MQSRELCRKAEILTQNPSYGNLAGLIQEICRELVKLENNMDNIKSDKQQIKKTESPECLNARPAKKKTGI